MQASKDLVDLVGKTPCAIGYSSFAYAVPGVKTACISAETGGSCIDPNSKSITDGSYPMMRPLYLYTNGQPEGEIKKYMDWVVSEDGQCILAERQYAPLRKLACGD